MKKQFALEQIVPYYKDPSMCEYNKERERCEYITEDGRMCVAGKNMEQPNLWDYSISFILNSHGQTVLKPEVRGILSTGEWKWLQRVHDRIATGEDLEKLFESPEALFTQEELKSFQP